MEHLAQKPTESLLEAQTRKDGNFPDVESQLVDRFGKTEMMHTDIATAALKMDTATALLGTHNPFGREAAPDHNNVWVLDNTAYRPVSSGNSDSAQPWEAEFVACYFNKGRKDITKVISNIADQIGLDGKTGTDEEVTKRIEQRVRPLIQAIAPARSIEISIPHPGPTGQPHKLLLGPSDTNGISSQILLTGGDTDDLDGKSVVSTSADDMFPDLKSNTRFAGPAGWGVISDIDDTIKITMTSSPTGILKSTFADIPQTTAGMPEFYKVLDESLKNPAWFYLSASPYNLYPFLHDFLKEHYPQGTMILRDASWMSLAGLLQSLTLGVKDYKVDRMQKIHRWLPQRKFICIGDSTQSDPEAYAEMYHKWGPDWIKAIYIRKVTDAPHMELKNRPSRFRDAFENVPDTVWRVFTDPKDIAEHFEHIAGTAHSGLMGNILRA